MIKRLYALHKLGLQPAPTVEALLTPVDLSRLEGLEGDALDAMIATLEAEVETNAERARLAINRWIMARVMNEALLFGLLVVVAMGAMFAVTKWG